MDQFQDQDPSETQEWLEALESVIKFQGQKRAGYLVKQLLDRAAAQGIPTPDAITTPFRNTIPTSREKRMPGDLFMERRRSEEHTSELQSRENLVCRLLLEKK